MFHFRFILLASLSIALLSQVTVSNAKSLSVAVNSIVAVLNASLAHISTKFCGESEQEIALLRTISVNSMIEATGNVQNHFGHLFIVDVGTCKSPEVWTIFKANTLGALYSSWLLVNSSSSLGTIDRNRIPEYIQHVDLTQHSEIYYLDNNYNNYWSLEMFYKNERVTGHEVLIEEVGYFSEDFGNFMDTGISRATSMRRKNMLGSRLPIASVLSHSDSRNHYFDYVDIEMDTVSKYGIRLTFVVLQFLNATPQIVVSPSWGSFNATTGWTGMMGDLVSGNVEMGATASFIRSERAHIVEYMSISLETSVKIVFLTPKLSYTTNVYLLPFRKSVWTAALLLFTTITLLLLTAVTGEWKLFYNGAQKFGEPRPRIIDIAFVVFSAICNQGSSFNPQSVGGRVILLSCLIFVVCLFVSYCAFIVVLLQSPSTNLQTVQDLLNSRMQVGCVDTLYNRYWLKLLTDPAEKALYERRIVNKDGSLNFYKLDDGVKKIQQRLFAFHMETPVGYRLVGKLFKEGEKCDLREIPFANMNSPYSTCRKHSPYREALRIGMLRVKEQGIQTRLWKEIYATKPKCINRNAFMPLTLIDISPAILILCFGMGASTIILMVEILMQRYSKANARK